MRPPKGWYVRKMGPSGCALIIERGTEERSQISTTCLA